jgi:AcrR family transcriptional regulator
VFGKSTVLAKQMSKSPRERRQARTRQAILNTALELIRENGPDNISLREIARRIDYSPAGLYEYFGSKDEIIDAVCSISNDKLWAYLSAVSTDLPFQHYMIQLLHAYIAYARDHSELFLLVNTTRIQGDAVEFPSDSSAVQEGDSFGILLRAVERGIREGQIQTTEEYRLIDIAYGLWSYAHGAAMLEMRLQKGISYNFNHANHHSIKALLRGLAP